MTLKEWLPLLNSGFQILFFVCIGFVTVLTYLKARKTILTPLRAEVFKQQLGVFTEILRVLVGKGKSELSNYFGFKELTRANIFKLLDAFGAEFYDLRVQKEQRPYSSQHCPGAVIAAKFLEPANDAVVVECDARVTRAADPRVRAARWAEFEFGDISLPKRHLEAVAHVERLAASPLLPKPCVALLIGLLKTVHQNVFILGRVLTECAKELPGKYGSAQLLRKAQVYWLANRYNNEFVDLEPHGVAVIEYVRNYLDVESLLE